jgi:SAM-dependent methyltransferase
MWDLKIWPAYHAVYSHPDSIKKKTYLDRCLCMVEIDGNKGLQVGCHDKYGKNWVSIDLHDKRPCIDYNIDICDSVAMSQFVNTFDVIQCNAVLEHVRQPFDAAINMIQALKPGGIIYVEVPFVQPYHPYSTYEAEHGLICDVDNNKTVGEHGGDYWRFTPQGVKELFKSLLMIEVFLCDEGGVVYVGEKI